MIYKKIAIPIDPATMYPNTVLSLWEQSLQDSIATIRAKTIATITMDDGFQMDDPLYDGIHPLMDDPSVFDTPEWTSFQNKLTVTIQTYLKNTLNQSNLPDYYDIGFHDDTATPKFAFKIGVKR